MGKTFRGKWNSFFFLRGEVHFRLFDGVFFYRFDASKSTKGASKLRRDLINAEIANLRDLLPLPPSTRQRLSQLQLMALVCVYVRKANYFQQGNTIHVLCLFLMAFYVYKKKTIHSIIENQLYEIEILRISIECNPTLYMDLERFKCVYEDLIIFDRFSHFLSRFLPSFNLYLCVVWVLKMAKWSTKSVGQGSRL